MMVSSPFFPIYLLCAVHRGCGQSAFSCSALHRSGITRRWMIWYHLVLQLAPLSVAMCSCRPLGRETFFSFSFRKHWLLPSNHKYRSLPSFAPLPSLYPSSCGAQRMMTMAVNLGAVYPPLTWTLILSRSSWAIPMLHSRSIEPPVFPVVKVCLVRLRGTELSPDTPFQRLHVRLRRSYTAGIRVALVGVSSPRAAGGIYSKLSDRGWPRVHFKTKKIMTGTMAGRKLFPSPGQKRGKR